MPLEKFLELLVIIKQNLDNRDIISAEKDSRISQLESENILLREQLAEALNNLAGALANDVADAEAIQAAEFRANEATAQLVESRNELQIIQEEFAAASEKNRMDNDALLNAIANAQETFVA